MHSNYQTLLEHITALVQNSSSSPFGQSGTPSQTLCKPKQVEFWDIKKDSERFEVPLNIGDKHWNSPISQISQVTCFPMFVASEPGAHMWLQIGFLVEFVEEKKSFMHKHSSDKSSQSITPSQTCNDFTKLGKYILLFLFTLYYVCNFIFQGRKNRWRCYFLDESTSIKKLTV